MRKRSADPGSKESSSTHHNQRATKRAAKEGMSTDVALPPPTPRLRVCVVGAGRIGAVHARSVRNNPRAVLSLIVGKTVARAVRLAAELQGRSGGEGAHIEGGDMTTFQVRLGEGQIDAVVLASPTDTHVALINRCVAVGVPVMVEKPVAFDPAEIRRCLAGAKAAGVPVLCAYQRRFDPEFVALKRHLEAETAGSLQLLLLWSRDHPPPPGGLSLSMGSFVQDFATHDVDTARWLVGEEPSAVYAASSAFLPDYRRAGVDDTAVLVLQFPSGVLCVIDNSRHAAHGYDIRVEAQCSAGMLQVTNPPRTQLVVSTEAGLRASPILHSYPERFELAYAAELDHFLDMVERREGGDAPLPRVSLEDCVQDATVTERAQRSIDKQFRPSVGRERWGGGGDEEETFFAGFPQAREGTVGVALLGVGRIGQIRARAVAAHPQAKLLYAVDVVPEALQAFAASGEHPGAETVLWDAWEARVLADPRVDALLVSTPSSTHCELILAALRAGKAVFCEKPLALSAADTLRCMEAARSARRPLYCGFQRRSDPSFCRLQRLVAADTPELIHITSRDGAAHNSLSYLSSSGGFFFDSLIHDFDEARWLAGEDPVEVFAAGSAFHPEIAKMGDHDCVVCVLRFPSGCIAHIDNHRRAFYGYDQRCEVHCSLGTYAAANPSTTTVSCYTAEGVVADCLTFDGMLRYTEAYASEVRHFLDLLLQREETGYPRVKPSDCLQGALIAEACMLSLSTGKPVQL